jgi:membrane protein
MRLMNATEARSPSAWLTNKVWKLVAATVHSCLRYRVTGLAAEAAFFAVLSIPPLIFALAGAIGYISERFTDAQVEDIRDAIIDFFLPSVDR